MTIAVLDASALLALLLGEKGEDKVHGMIGDCAISTVNLGEVVGHFARAGASEPDIHAMLDPLPCARIPLDEELAFGAGLLVPTTREAGLSFGDRVCLTLASRLGVPALTADRAWQRVASKASVAVELIR